MRSSRPVTTLIGAGGGGGGLARRDRAWPHADERSTGPGADRAATPPARYVAFAETEHADGLRVVVELRTRTLTTIFVRTSSLSYRAKIRCTSLETVGLAHLRSVSITFSASPVVSGVPNQRRLRFKRHTRTVNALLAMRRT